MTIEVVPSLRPQAPALVAAAREEPTGSRAGQIRVPPPASTMASPLPTWEDVRHPSLPAADASAEAWAAWLLEHADESLLHLGVLDIPMLSDAGAAALFGRTLALQGLGGDTVGSMHRYGTDLLQHSSFAGLIGEAYAAIAGGVQLAFLGGAGKRMGCSSAHTIAYGVADGREHKLALHVDDSLITVNLCLGKEGFEGSELYFTGWQPLTWEPVARAQRKRAALAGAAAGLDSSEVKVKPRPGRALVHFGHHPHRTVEIAAGTRCNWVLWFRPVEADAEAEAAA